MNVHDVYPTDDVEVYYFLARELGDPMPVGDTLREP